MRSHLIFQSGVVANADVPGVSMNEAAANRFNFHFGDYVCIASDARSTLIIRELKPLRLPKKARIEYVYLDRQSLRLLQVDLDEPLEVWPSALKLECP